MGKINHSRVILGGIIAGILINILEYLVHDVILKAQHAETMKGLGRAMPEGGSTIAVWFVYGFLWAFVAIWLYAAIRPRFGPGPKTAVCAAFAAWFFGPFLSGIAMWNMAILPLSPLEMALELVAFIIAVLGGAALYKEAA